MPNEMILCLLSDIPEGGAKALQANINGKQQPLVAVRRGEHVWLYRNCCPHLPAWRVLHLSESDPDVCPPLSNVSVRRWGMRGWALCRGPS